MPAGTGNANFNDWAVINADGTLETRTIFGNQPSQVLARVDVCGADDPAGVYYDLTDWQGSVQVVIDSTGAIKDALVYDAFGNITYESNSYYRGWYAWTGRQLDGETGLQYNNARWYDSTTGNWITQDPLGFDAGDSNLYRYANNAPMNGTDPSGNWTVSGMLADVRQSDIGKRVLAAFVSKNTDIEVWKVAYAKWYFKNKENEKWSVKNLFGATFERDSSYSVPGKVRVVIAEQSSGKEVDDLDAAATFVHELTHAIGYFPDLYKSTYKGIITTKLSKMEGYEPDARIVDQSFYQQLGPKGIARLIAHYEGTEGVVVAKDGKSVTLDQDAYYKGLNSSSSWSGTTLADPSGKTIYDIGSGQMINSLIVPPAASPKASLTDWNEAQDNVIRGVTGFHQPIIKVQKAAGQFVVQGDPGTYSSLAAVLKAYPSTKTTIDYTPLPQNPMNLSAVSVSRLRSYVDAVNSQSPKGITWIIKQQDSPSGEEYRAAWKGNQLMTETKALGTVYANGFHEDKGSTAHPLNVVEIWGHADSEGMTWLFRFKVQIRCVLGILVSWPVHTLIAAARSARSRPRVHLCQGRPWLISPSTSICPKALPSPGIIASPMRTASKFPGPCLKRAVVLVVKPSSRHAWKPISTSAKRGSSAISIFLASPASSAIKPFSIAAPNAITARTSCRRSNAKTPVTPIASRNEFCRCSSARTKPRWRGDWASPRRRCVSSSRTNWPTAKA